MEEESLERTTCHTTTSGIPERVAVLEERSNYHRKRIDAIREDLETLESKIATMREALRDIEADAVRVGGAATHEDHHRHVGKLIEKKLERRATVRKVKEDVLSKTALWLISVIVACGTYLYHVLPKLFG